MNKLYYSIIKFLYNNYIGTRKFKIGKYTIFPVKAARIMFPFFIVWGITLILFPYIYWYNIVFGILLVVQFIAGFSEIIKNEYNRLNNN